MKAPLRRTLREIYAERRVSRLGMLVGAQLNGTLDQFNVSADELAARIEAAGYEVLPESEIPPSPARKADDPCWKLEYDFHATVRANAAGARKRVVLLTAHHEGKRIAASSHTLNAHNRFNGHAVMHAARKLQRKIAKQGFQTISDTFNIEGFRSLNRAAA